MFEAAGAAACQVTDAWVGIEEFFAPGDEILVAASAEEVAALVRSTGDDDARRIGEAARGARSKRTPTASARHCWTPILRAPVGSAA
jgi:spore maturation protein CgeB